MEFSPREILGRAKIIEQFFEAELTQLEKERKRWEEKTEKILAEIEQLKQELGTGFLRETDNDQEESLVKKMSARLLNVYLQQIQQVYNLKQEFVTTAESTSSFKHQEGRSGSG
jgi:Skp family chaperone for outer membrane proteins